MEANFNLQGSPNRLQLQGPDISSPNRPNNTFSVQPPQGQLNLQGPEPTFNNTSSPEPTFNNTSSSEATFNFNGPPSHYGPNNNQISQMAPLDSAQLKAYIRKKPYTQMLDGQQITYSVLPKKQATFVMTHDRFLLLKGTDFIAYARQFPEKAFLPFRAVHEIPSFKSTKPVGQIERVNVKEDQLIITFSGRDKLTWEFQCPSKRCANKWAQKIDEAMMRGGGNNRETGRFGGGGIMDSRIRRENVNQINSYLNTNNNPSFNSSLQGPTFNGNVTGQSNFNASIEPPRIDTNKSVFETRKTDNIKIEEGPPAFNTSFQSNNYESSNNFSVNANFNNGRGVSPPRDNIMFSQANTLGSRSNLHHEQSKKYFQGNQMNKVEDFISSRGVERLGYQPQLFRSKSISQMNINEKEHVRREVAKMRRNWIQQLLGGQEEVELIIDFKSYVQKIAAIIITQLYVGQNQKIFPATQITRDFASFVLDDVYIELFFFNQQIEDKHPRFKRASLEFKNLDYLLSVTKNEGTLKVPFMMLFEYKGFLGMARTRLPEGPSKNRECVNQLNVREFQESTRISVDALLNEQTCKITSYYRRTPISTTSYNNGNVYFVERLLELLPLEKQNENIPTHVLRPELLLDKAFNGTVFRSRLRPVRMDGVGQIIDLKINLLIKFIENEEEYFTNSRELEEMLHLTGLSMRHLGIMYQRSRLAWFKRIIQAQIVARALKNLFRKDIQNCVMIQSERNKSRQRQQDYEKRRVISFLNVVFGNTQDTAQVWKRINRICQERFGIAVSQSDISGANVPFMMQAIQTHLKIVLNDSIHRKRYFQSPQTFDPQDFNRFDFDTNIYNLEFTNLFQEIQDCMDFQTAESFYNLSSILIKETSNRVPVIDMLKKHPIHERISQFLLNFTSPEESQDLYSRMEIEARPSRFLYESKLAEIKWYLKMNRLQKLQRPASFIFENGRKWLGEVHPMFTQVSRIIASYFSEQPQHFNLAIKYAQDSLEMQRKVFGGESDSLWKDYFLLGKIYFTNKNIEQGMKYLVKSSEMIRPQEMNDFETYAELNLLLCKGHFGARRYTDAYNTAKQLYSLLRHRKDEKSLGFLLDSVGWMRQILEMTQQYHTYFQFLESDFSNQLKAFSEYPSILVSAIRTVAIPTLKNAIVFKSRNGMRIMSLLQDLSRMTQGSQSTLSTYLRETIINGTYPRSFLLQLKDIDNLVDEVYETKSLDRWKSFYQNSSQSVLDTMGSAQVNRTFQFLANLTVLFNLFGRQIMDQLSKK